MLRRVTVAAAILLTFVAFPANAQAPTYQGYPVVNVVVDGQALQGEVPAILMDGRTMVPVRALAEQAGFEIGWDAATQTATLTSKAGAASLQRRVDELERQMKQLQDQVANQVGQSAPPVAKQIVLPDTSSRLYQDAVGSTWVSVSFINPTFTSATVVDVEAIAKNGAGQTLATGTRHLGGLVLDPGMTAAISFPLSKPVPDTSSVEFRIIAQPTEQHSPNISVWETKLTKDTAGVWRATGVVRNDGQTTLNGVLLYVTFLDKGRRIVEGVEGIGRVQTLKAGESTTFDIPALHAAAEPGYVDITPAASKP